VTRKYSAARNKYRPEGIRVLLIAESPPSSEGFFYFERTIGKDHLFRETMKALELWPRDKAMRRGLDKKQLLREFRSRGFFLIDICDFPVDKLSASRRKASIILGASKLPGKVRRLDPDVIVIVKKTLYGVVREVLKEAGLGGRIVNTDSLPFPSHGNQAKYRKMLRRFLRKTDRTQARREGSC